MNEELISMYIDDELSLEEKIAFVERVHADSGFKDETLAFLGQEKILAAPVTDRVPALPLREKRHIASMLFKPLGYVASGLAAASLVLFLWAPWQQRDVAAYRFVVYKPEVSKVEITGSFTGWKNTPLKKIGESGYWEIVMDLPKAEQRYTYIVNGGQRFADPTVLTREPDDLGGENSVLPVEEII
jgi:hypothetical protein